MGYRWQWLGWHTLPVSEEGGGEGGYRGLQVAVAGLAHRPSEW